MKGIVSTMPFTRWIGWLFFLYSISRFVKHLGAFSFHWLLQRRGQRFRRIFPGFYTESGLLILPLPVTNIYKNLHWYSGCHCMWLHSIVQQLNALNQKIRWTDKISYYWLKFTYSICTELKQWCVRIIIFMLEGSHWCNIFCSLPKRVFSLFISEAFCTSLHPNNLVVFLTELTAATVMTASFNMYSNIPNSLLSYLTF